MTHIWKLPHNPLADRLNSRIEAPGEYYAYAAALLIYKSGSPYNKIPQALKYDYNRGAGRRFAKMLGERLREAAHFADVDLIVPVPLHWTRRLRRGYNQAEMLARGMAEVTQLPVVNLLRRTENRTSQTHLSGEERRKNAEGIYKAIAIPKEWRGKHLVLVDDVMTTGSTLANCAAALHEADRSLQISVLPLAFAGE